MCAATHGRRQRQAFRAAHRPGTRRPDAPPPTGALPEGLPPGRAAGRAPHHATVGGGPAGDPGLRVRRVRRGRAAGRVPGRCIPAERRAHRYRRYARRVHGARERRGRVAYRRGRGQAGRGLRQELGRIPQAAVGYGRRRVRRVRAGDAGARPRQRGGRCGGDGLAGEREASAAGAGAAGLGQPFRELLALLRQDVVVQDGRRDGAKHLRRRGRHLLGEGAGAEVSHRPAGAAVALRARWSGRSLARSRGQAAGDADHVRLPVLQAVHALLAARRACV